MKRKKITGRLRTNPRGFGFVEPDDSSMQDIFISKNDIKNAIDKDIVEVELKPNPLKGLEGKILKILKREKKVLAGIIVEKYKSYYVAYVPLLGPHWPVIVNSQDKLNVGDRIQMKVKNWEDKDKNTIAEKTKYLSHISDAAKDIEAAIEEFDITDKFPNSVLKEADKLTITKKDLNNRKDFSKLFCVTIDPVDAKDFDDSISLEKNKDGSFKLGVHITDVAHFIKPNSNLDKEAAKRANSVYFPGRCIPMIPTKLSSGLCSLQPDEIRLTVSVVMDIDKDGTLKKYEIHRSFIKSKKRLTYEQALNILNSKNTSPVKKLLTHMVELCLILKKQRFDRGSIDFALPEAKVQIDENGMPTGIKIIKYDITHQMIEEFMLKANEIVAKHLDNKGKTLIFRIHEEPSKDSFLEFFDLARRLGFFVPSNPTQKDIQKLFFEAKDSVYLRLLSISFIRSMKLAYYSPDNIGHFGLALEHYTHFTSPIRRYSDLIIQRILFKEEQEGLEIEKIAQNCSEKERNAFKAESKTVLLKKLRLLKKSFKKNPNKKYSAKITKIKSFGIAFELQDFLLDGFIHVESMHFDYFEYDEKRSMLTGRHTNTKYAFSTPIEVIITSIDLIMLEVKYSIANKKSKKKRKK